MGYMISIYLSYLDGKIVYSVVSIYSIIHNRFLYII